MREIDAVDGRLNPNNPIRMTHIYAQQRPSQALIESRRLLTMV